MGCCLSFRSSPTFKNVRVVHLNGYVQDFDHPVTACEVTGEPAKHFVCTGAQLLSPLSIPLKPNTQLQQGHVYFLLPFSTFQSDASPMDLAAIVRKLTAVAKSTRHDAKSQLNHLFSNQHGSGRVEPMNEVAGRVEPMNEVAAACDPQKSCRARSWKPILDTIREKSFTRRSESDLQDLN